MLREPIAITGIGLVCSLGNSLPAALERARRGESGIRTYESHWVDPKHASLRTRVGGTVEGFEPTNAMETHLAARQEPAVLYALVAAEEALAQAAFDDEVDRTRIGTVVGAGLPGAELWHRGLYASYGKDRPDEVARMTAISITGNAAAAQLALRHRLQGPSLGIANACASGTAALSSAMDQIWLGRADAMVVGGCESSMRSLLTYACFVDAGMNATSEPVGACAPFSATRRGFVLAEGAAIFVIERLSSARARGARVLALLAGAALTNDAYHVISPDPSGDQWARTIRLALAEAGVHPDEVDAVNAHATATQQGDIAETRALKQVFGARAKDVPISATKSMHGHAFGAAGAIELALAVGAMNEGVVLPTINLSAQDPECDLDYVPNQARTRDTRVLVKNGFGAGGAASCLVVKSQEVYS